MLTASTVQAAETNNHFPCFSTRDVLVNVDQRTVASMYCSGHENMGKKARNAHLFLQHALHKVRHLGILVLFSNALQLLQLLKVQFLKRQGKLHGVQCISLAMRATKV